METTTQGFENDVLRQSFERPVLVDFWAPWCGPCRMVGPVLEKLSGEAQGRWALVKLNTEEHPQLASQFRISSIPAMKLFSQGEVVAEMVGALPEPQMRQWIEDHIPGPAKKLLAAAKLARADGDAATAEAICRRALEEEPEHAETRVMLAGLVLFQDAAEALSLVESIDDGSLINDIEALRRLAGLLSGAIGPNGQGDNTSVAWASYRGGVEALGRQDFDGAAKAWIEAVRRDRHLDDEGARQACVALFTWLGPDHPVTQENRSSFASALF